MKFNFNFVKQLFFIFCLSVCLYQIYTICEIYFSYKTTTSVSYGDFSVISLPAITICFNKIDVLKDHHLDQLNISRNGVNKHESQIVVKIFCSNYTVRQQFDMFYPFKDIFSLCQVSGNRFINKTSNKNKTNENKYYDKCERLSPIRKSINYDK